MRSFESYAYCAIIAESTKRGINLIERIRKDDPDLLAIAEKGQELYFEELARRRAQGLVPSGAVEFAVSQDGRHDPRRVLGAPSYEYQPIQAANDAGYLKAWSSNRDAKSGKLLPQRSVNVARRGRGPGLCPARK